LTVPENGTATFTITASKAPTSNIILNLSDPKSPFTITNPVGRSATFTPTTLTKTITVKAADDTNTVSEKSIITIRHHGSNLFVGEVAITADDDDLGLDLYTTDLAVAEDGSDTFTVALNTQPTAEVIVSFAKSGTNPTAANIAPSSLTFSTTNWETPQSVTVNGVDDSTDQPAGSNLTFTIDITASGGGYGSATGTVNVTVIDDERTSLLDTTMDVRHSTSSNLIGYCSASGCSTAFGTLDDQTFVFKTTTYTINSILQSTSGQIRLATTPNLPEESSSSVVELNKMYLTVDDTTYHGGWYSEGDTVYVYYQDKGDLNLTSGDDDITVKLEI